MKYLKKIKKGFVLFALLNLLIANQSIAQDFQDPRDCGFSCSASDLVINNVFLASDDTGTPYEGTCTLGVTESVYACFSITNTTNSRRSATIFGLTITQNDIFQENIITCFPQVLQGKTTYTFCTTINYTCGTDLKIVDGFVGWSANGNGDCPFIGQTCIDSPNYIPPGKCIENISIDIEEPLIANFSTNCGSTNTINFVNESVGGKAPYNYAWDFGDGSSSNLENPTHNYSSAGIFTVSLTITDADNVQQVRNFNVDVSACNCPNNNITGTSINICQGTEINLNDYINGTIHGTLNFSSVIGNWTTNHLVTPSISTTYFVRDSSTTTNCVDTAQISIIVLDTFQTQINQTICQGETFEFNNQSLSNTGVFRDTLQTANSCDSFIVLNLTVLDTFQTQINQTICQGETFEFNNQSLSNAGVFRDTLPATNSCDSFIVLNLTVLDTFQTQINQTICQGETFEFNNQSLSNSGVFRDTLLAVNSCDSFIVLNLTVLDTFQTQINQTICQGETFEFNNQSLNSSGTFRDTLLAVNSCDSFIVLNLTVLDTFQTQINQTICQGETFEFNNQSLSNTGVFRDTLPAANSCDGFIVLNLTVLDTFQTQIIQTICQGETFEFNNQSLSNAGVFRDTLPAANSCDSFIVLNLTVLDTFQTQINQTICQGETFEFNNQSLSNAGVFRDTLQANNGCDSIIQLSLTVNPVTTGVAYYSGCVGDGYALTINGNTYNEQNAMGIEVLTNAYGCDSILTIELFFESLSIGNLVFEDLDNDGIAEMGESGISDIELILYDTLNNEIGRDTTDSYGNYRFDNLPEGNYYVQLNKGIPLGMHSSTGTSNSNGFETAPDPDNNINDDDNGIQNADKIISGNISLIKNKEPQNDGDDNPATNLSLDFGLIRLQNLQNVVWEDLNGDGIQNDGDTTGIANAVVHLTGTDATGALISLTTTTDENGVYFFDDLLPGSYQVQIIPPTNFEITPDNQGSNDTLDSNLGQDSLMTIEILPNDSSHLNFATGLYQPVSINGLTWVDINADGIQNDGDTAAFADVTVYLNGINGLGDSITLMTITDENGNYSFPQLLPGEYNVSFRIPQKYQVSTQNTGTDSTIDSDADTLGYVSMIKITSGGDNISYDLGLIPDFDLALTIQLALDEERVIEDGDTITFFLTIYNQGKADAFGINVKNSIPKGLVFHSNLNELQSTQWQSDSSITINQLFSGDSVIVPLQLVINTALMDSVVMNQAEITTASRVSGMGAANDIDSFADNDFFNDKVGGNNYTENESDDEDDHDFSYVIYLEEADPIGYIYCEKTGKILTGGKIIVTPPTSGIVFMAFDGEDGKYKWFTNGVPGTYTMRYSHPDGFPISTTCLPQAGAYDPTGRDGATEDNDGITDNGLISLGTSIIQEEKLVDVSCDKNAYYLSFTFEANDPIIENNHIPIKCARISSTVCEDKNRNGQHDSAENYLEGIEVNLYDCSDTLNPIATTLTQLDGVYEFDGLPAGNYIVQFVPPASHRFALDNSPIGTLEARNGFSECTTLAFGQCDTTINACLIPCPEVVISSSVQTLYFGQSMTATATGGDHFKWTPNIEIDCDTCQTVRITPTESRTYTVTADDTYGCNNSAELKVNVLYNTARIYNPCECEVDNFFNPTGKFTEQIVILSTIPNETWTLVENNGILSTTNSLIAVGTNFSAVENEGLFYKYILDIKHQDGIGYNGKVSNGTDSFAVGNICFTENSCRVIIPPTTPTGTPPPPMLGCVDIINASNTTPAVSTLENCEGCEFRSEGSEDAALYRDESPRNNVHTIHPSNQWQTVMTTFTHFDLAAGDTLYVFDGPDTLSNLLGKYSGAGVSQTNGWVAASCQPAINPTGSLTFQFKTNGDRRKGTGWIANNTCLTDETTLTAPNNLQDRLTCAETYKVFTINPATVTSNCSAIQDSQLVRIYDKHHKLCVDTILAYNKNFQETFAIGEYRIEYKLKTDTIKTDQTVISVQGPNLVCNDKVTVPLGAGCSIMLSPDDLLENPCDTITDTMYYHITLEYVDKKGDKQTISGGGKGGQYPIIDKEMLGTCGGLITATIERRYYEGLTLSFCNNGTQEEKCEVEVAITDESNPWILEVATIDTFIACQIDLTAEGLGLAIPEAIDNCSEARVSFNGANIISEGSEVCDTTKVAVEWLATDACGNSTTATQTVVFIRPSLAQLVQTKDETLACDGANTSEGSRPSLQIGQWKNGQLIPSDTIPLSTETYICGYILQKREVAIPATDCGKKLFRYWSILDWCNAESRPQDIDTTLVEFLDTNPPEFETNEEVLTIELDHNSCVYDINKLTTPKAKDNCSIPVVKLDKVSSIENGNRWTIPENEWATLANDSFELRWIAADICQEQLINDTLTQILVLKDITQPSAICADNIQLSLGQGNAQLHYRDIDGGAFDACGIAKYEVSRNNVTWDSIVVFDCEDIHQTVTVSLRVTDKNGNQNTCWMTVEVADKLMPICSDLPDAKGTCEENHLADLGESTDANGNGLLDDAWKDMTVAQIELFNTQYGNPICSDNISCGALIIQQQYQLVPKKCGVIDIQRRFRAIDWDGQGNISNWSTQNIYIEPTAAWSITLPSDWEGHCNQTIPDSEVYLTNGACDLMAYEMEEKVFTSTENACQKVIRTFTITNWCTYEAGQPTIKIARDENIHGKVTSPRIITPITIGAEFENVGRLEYSQILETKELAQTDMASVSGVVKDWKGQTVEEVMVSTTTSTEMMTQADGFYHFELPMSHPYTIQPQKEDAPLNGVSTFDLVLISKHILGISQFDNPYQLIAADANKSGTITAFDMVQIRQLILNIKTEYTNNESWRFVDAAYEFTSTNPVQENFPEVIQIDHLAQDMERDFVAIKVGDVNGNAISNSLTKAEDRTTTSVFEITTADKILKAGERYTVAFNTTQLADIQGYQFTLGYENLKLEKLNSGVARVENFGLHKMEEGMITTSWNQSAVGSEQLAVGSGQLAVGSGQRAVSSEQPSTVNRPPSTVLFNIEFTALKDGKLSEQLSLISRPTTIEAYSAGTRLGDIAGTLMDIQLTFTTPVANNKLELFQNEPNPFYEHTTIGFYLPIDSEVELILRDETGRVLKTIKQNRTAGYNIIKLDIAELNNSIIYYQLSTKYNTKVKKMIQLK